MGGGLSQLTRATPPVENWHNRGRSLLKRNEIEELEAMFAKLFVMAENLPPGPDRREALREIGLIRLRLDATARDLNVRSNTREGARPRPPSNARWPERGPAPEVMSDWAAFP